MEKPQYEIDLERICHVDVEEFNVEFDKLQEARKLHDVLNSKCLCGKNSYGIVGLIPHKESIISNGKGIVNVTPVCESCFNIIDGLLNTVDWTVVV